MKKWHQKRWAPWAFLGAMFTIGLVGLMAAGAIGVVSPTGSSSHAAAVTFATVWLTLGIFLITPASIITAIIWARRIRPELSPLEVAEKRAREAEASAAREARRAAANEERQQRAADAEARKSNAAIQKRARQTEAASRVADKPSRTRYSEIQVAYLRGLEPKNTWQLYTFSWPFPEEPTIGSYVVVPGGTLTQVLALGRGSYDGPLKSITRVATTKDIQRARRGGGVRFQ